MGERRLSTRGEAFIAHFEGLRTKLYNDPAGHRSIGVGHLVDLGRCNGPGRRRRSATASRGTRPSA